MLTIDEALKLLSEGQELESVVNMLIMELDDSKLSVAERALLKEVEASIANEKKKPEAERDYTYLRRLTTTRTELMNRANRRLGSPMNHEVSKDSKRGSTEQIPRRSSFVITRPDEKPKR